MLNPFAFGKNIISDFHMPFLNFISLARAPLLDFRVNIFNIFCFFLSYNPMNSRKKFHSIGTFKAIDQFCDLSDIFKCIFVRLQVFFCFFTCFFSVFKWFAWIIATITITINKMSFYVVENMAKILCIWSILTFYII